MNWVNSEENALKHTQALEKLEKHLPKDPIYPAVLKIIFIYFLYDFSFAPRLFIFVCCLPLALLARCLSKCFFASVLAKV